MSGSAAPDPEVPSDPVPGAPVPTGATIPLHAAGPVARLVEAMDRDGVDAAPQTSRDALEGMLRILAPALADMEGTVSHVDWLVVQDPSQPLHGSWTIVWSDGNETTVSIDHDGDATALDQTGTRWRHVGSNGLRLVTVRHVRRVLGGAVASLSAVVDVERLAMPEDEPDGRRPVHVARTVAKLIVAAGVRRLDPFGRVAVPSPEHADTLPDDGPARPASITAEADLATAVGVAVLLDAGREDLLSLPAHAPAAAVRLRRPSALAPGLCVVGGHGPEGISHPAPDTLPAQPISLSASANVDRRRGVSHAVATLSTPTTEADLGGHDAVHNIRLALLAEPWRTRPETRP